MNKHLLLALSMLLLLTAVSASLAQSPTAAGTPPQYSFALQALSEYLGRPVRSADVTQWSYTIGIFNNTALGCPLVTAQPLASPVQGFQFQISLGAATYDVRVSADGAIAFPCVNPASPSAATPAIMPTPGAVTPAPPSAAAPCPAGFSGFLPPRLNIGAEARVPVGNMPSRIREQPSLSGRQIGMINPNTTARVVGGPSCDPAGGIIWWQVNYNGVIGWTAEGVLPNDYFLDPVGSVTPPTASGLPTEGGAPLPIERSAISSANVLNLGVLTSLPVAEVSAIAFDPNGAQMALLSAGAPQIFSLPDLAISEVTAPADAADPATALTFIDPNTLLLGYGSGRLARLRLDTGALAPLVDSAPFPIVSFSLSSTPRDASPQQLPANRVAVAASPELIPPEGGGRAAGVYVFDLASGRMLIRIDSARLIDRAAYSPDGTLLAYIDGALHLIDVAANRELSNRVLDAATIFGPLAWRPVSDPGTVNAEDILAYASGRDVEVLNVRSGQIQRYPLDDDTRRPVQIAFSRDGSLLIVLTSDRLRGAAPVLPGRLAILDYVTGDLVFDLDVDGLATFALSPEGTLLALSDGVEVTLWGVP
jgi:hypothetical protein